MNFGKPSISFQSERDIPSLTGKTILITGANIGLGKQCVLEYARHQPSLIWLAARDLTKAQAAADEIQTQLSTPVTIKLLEIDLASVESIKIAAKKVLEESDRLDILMLNAGIMASPAGLTKDGYELQFGTNYFGHVLLTTLLIPLLERTASIPDADVRVVAVSSHGHISAPKEGFRSETIKTTAEELGPFERYGQSKLALILWVRQMAKLYSQVTWASVHPGLVRTNLVNNMGGSSFAIRVLGKVANRVVTTVDKGARNQIWASLGKGVISGEYYEPVGIKDCGSELCRSDELGETVWSWTEEELKIYG